MSNKTTIQIYKETAFRLRKNQESFNETYDAILNRVLDYYEKKEAKGKE